MTLAESRQGDRTAHSGVFKTRSHWIYRPWKFSSISNLNPYSCRVCNVVGSELTINQSVSCWFSRANARCTPLTEWGSVKFDVVEHQGLPLPQVKLLQLLPANARSPHPTIGLEAEPIVLFLDVAGYDAAVDDPQTHGQPGKRL